MRKIMNTKGAVRRMNYGSCLLLLLVLFSCTLPIFLYNFGMSCFCVPNRGNYAQQLQL